MTADHGPAVSGAHNTIVLAPKSRRSVGIGDTSRLVTVLTRRRRDVWGLHELARTWFPPCAVVGPRRVSSDIQWYLVIIRHPDDTETFAAPVLSCSQVCWPLDHALVAHWTMQQRCRLADWRHGSTSALFFFRGLQRRETVAFHRRSAGKSLEQCRDFGCSFWVRRAATGVAGC